MDTCSVNTLLRNDCASRGSELYYIEPIGVGTPYVESLTSYISRMAEAHCVSESVLIHRLLIPSSRVQHRNRNTINGLYILANKLVQVLQEKTLRNDLNVLTLLHLSSVLPQRNLNKPEKAWCPLCYRHWKQEKLPIYDPLIWYITGIESCPIHKIRLVNQCPHCGRQIESHSRPGICSLCRLSLDVVQGLEEWKPDERTNWVESNCISLVDVQLRKSTLLNTNIIKSVESFVAVSKGIHNFARLCKFSYGQIQSWLRGQQLMPLDTLLTCSWVFQIPLGNILTGHTVSEGWNRSIGQLSGVRNISSTVLTRAREVFEQSPPENLTQLAGKVGCSQGTLRKYMPNVGDLIRTSENRKVYAHPSTTTIRDPYNRDKARREIQFWLDSGEFLTTGEVARRVGIVYSTFRVYFPDLYKRAREQYSTNVAILKERTILELQQIHDIDQIPPRSLSQIARSLGRSVNTLKRIAPELCDSTQRKYHQYYKQSSRPPCRKLRAPQNYQSVAKQVEEALTVVPAITLEKFYAKYGCSIKRFPELIEKIKSNFVLYKHNEVLTRCLQIREAVCHINAQSMYPSIKLVEEFTSFGGFSSNEVYRLVWLEALKELNIEVKSFPLVT